MEFKHGFRAGNNIGNRCSSYGRNKQRQQRRHRKIDHQYFQREHQSCNRRFENARNGPGSTTPHKQHQRTMFHLEHTS